MSLTDNEKRDYLESLIRQWSLDKYGHELNNNTDSAAVLDSKIAAAQTALDALA